MINLFRLGIPFSPSAMLPAGRKFWSVPPGAFRLGGAFLLLQAIHPAALFAQAKTLTAGQMLQKSGFVFQGTIKKLGAATAQIPVEERTAIVHVDAILDGADTVGRFTGQDVTLRLTAGETAGEGDSRVFYANPYTFRKTAGFNEVGSQPVEQAKLLALSIPRTRLAVQDKATGIRLTRSELVVIGTVEKTGIARDVPAPREEHDPNWFEATVKVESVEKGQAPEGSLTVFYADNNDSRWSRAPKLKPGERALFLLQTDKDKALGLKGYFVVDPSDVRPLAERERVHSLILKAVK